MSMFLLFAPKFWLIRVSGVIFNSLTKKIIKMATKDEISAGFEELNIKVVDSVLNKCLELCIAYNLEAEDFCDQWCAFTASNYNGALPTIELLEKMERKEFHKKEQSYSKLNINDELVEDRRRNHNESAALTPQHPKITENSPYTPTTQNRQDNFSHNATPVSVKSSEKFSQRKDSRSVQSHFGSTTASFKRESNVVLSTKEVEDHKISAGVKYMYEIIGNKARSMNNAIRNLGHAILDNHGLNLSQGLLINQMGEMVTYGRIVSDSDGRINSQSILLEGTDETNLCYTTRLNLSKLSSYSLFPGQVIAAKGNNVKNLAFVAEKIYTDAHLDSPEPPLVQNGTMQIVIAAGPFTFKENLSYEPLNELIKYITEHEPHVVILTGPFLEKTHDSVLNGSLTQTFDSFFAEVIDVLMSSIQHKDTQVVVVSSSKDVHHHPIYPTPPYKITEKYSKLLFVPDPAVIDVDGLVIAATTVDVLFHMSNYELHFDKESVIKSGRMERMISHLLNQKQIYPLCPAHKELNVDQILLQQFGTLSVKPHILVLPSNLKNFVKEVNDCLVINPERLTKGLEAGTFARVEIEPGKSRSLCNRAAVQILRV
ncbi:DNA polymerase alpha subunit B [Diabrotica virgifera virgifera]|uniref:DNA polymerase alpha subunit B n=1 Tax=Diabrotica virgifera virgifera TaxID=50390 RepID=A0ABM5K429_DIAVI|nr:DNA polymerase alpha subunit B [Diabrotica virgifera virgifera]